MEDIEIKTPPLQEILMSSAFDKKRAFFDSGATLSYQFRKSALLKLKRELLKAESRVYSALHTDLNKSQTEAYATEFGPVIQELDHTLKNLKDWMKPHRKPTPVALEPSISEVRSDPKGVVLIIAPWNYPFYLSLVPLIGAIASGNAGILKPAENTPKTSLLLGQIIETTFSSDYYSSVQGLGHEVVTPLMEKYVFNHIFFTGSTAVGKIIAKSAAENLTSTTLELGGKSPAIIDSSANLKVSARRIAWGKFTNAGQTCVSPDYLVIEENYVDTFLDQLKNTIHNFYGSDAAQSPDYARMISSDHFDEVEGYLKDGTIFFGGKSDRAARYIEPTILTEISLESSIMKNEIFGPILPVLTFKDNNELLKIVRANRYPLSCYYFGTNAARRDFILNRIEFGGGSLNNAVVHLGNAALPFGGVQSSGAGHYHGWYSFDCFSNSKSVLRSKTWFDPSIRYPPYSNRKYKWLKRIFKLG